jgi:hypothetical protein
MRCGACSKAAAAPATVSDEPQSDSHWIHSLIREGDLRQRPASQETCRQQWSCANAPVGVNRSEAFPKREMRWAQACRGDVSPLPRGHALSLFQLSLP